MLSSVKLAFDTFYLQEDKNSKLIIWSERVDIFFNISFLIEMMLKLVAIGLMMDSGSYLRESWNQLDFFIVISSLLDMGLSNVDIPAIKILRLLRALRPLRFISHNVALKMIVVALLESVGGIFNVMIVVFVVWLIFAIMGVNNFGGKFFYCNLRVVHRRFLLLNLGHIPTQEDRNEFDNLLRANRMIKCINLSR